MNWHPLEGPGRLVEDKGMSMNLLVFCGFLALSKLAGCLPSTVYPKQNSQKSKNQLLPTDPDWSPKWRSQLTHLKLWKRSRIKPPKKKRRKSTFLRWLRTKKWRSWAVDTWITWRFCHHRWVFCCDYLDRGKSPKVTTLSVYNGLPMLQPWGCNPNHRMHSLRLPGGSFVRTDF